MSRRLAKVPVAKIAATDTVRDVDLAWVKALAEQMKAEGQLQPIEVAAAGGGYRLVFGLHRLRAAEILRWKTIDALIDDAGGDDETLRRRAIHENLFRRELSYLDRAVHVAGLHALHKAEVGERRGGARDQKSDARTFGLLEEVAEKVGLSRTSVADLRFIADGVAPRVRSRIVRSAKLGRIADSRADLMALAKALLADGTAVSADEREAWQLEILDMIEASEADLTVAEAISGERAKPGQKEWLKRSLDSFDRLKPDGQFQFLTEREAVVKAFAREKGWL